VVAVDPNHNILCSAYTLKIPSFSTGYSTWGRHRAAIAAGNGATNRGAGASRQAPIGETLRDRGEGREPL